VAATPRLKPAAALATRYGAQLKARPTWLFSSGPIGDPPRPHAADAVDVEKIVAGDGTRSIGCSPARETGASRAFPTAP
jgi:menaquinone-dependent protoporphyrinogen oxidase